MRAGRPTSLAAALAAPALLAAGPDAALAAPTSPAKAPAEQVVPIVYTSKVAGLFRSRYQVNEVAPLFDGDEDDGVRGGGVTPAPYALRHGQWHLWAASGPPVTALTGKALFAGAGVRLTGPKRAVPVLASDYVVLAEEPGPEPPWLAPWLMRRGAAHLPDARLVQGAIYDATGPAGEPLRILSEDGTRPPAGVLRDAGAWVVAHSAIGTAERGGQPTRFQTFMRSYGGPALHGLAGRWRREAGALRIDTGDLVDDPQDAAGAMGLEAALAALPGLGLDALVPRENELRLAPADQARLAAAVPLVAANLRGPAGVPVRPWVLREVAGVRVGVLGLADAYALRRRGLVGGPTGWTAEDPVAALPRTLRELEAAGAEAIVVATNLGEDQLADVRPWMWGVAAVIAADPLRPEEAFRERVVPSDPARARERRPWLQAGTSRDQVGLLRLGLRRRADGTAYPAWADNEVRHPAGHLEPDPFPAATWRYQERLAAFVAARQDVVLPDVRKLSAHDPRFALQGRDLAQFDMMRWTRLVATALRRETGAEAAVMPRLRAASSLVGDVVRYHAEKWVPAEPVVIADLTGAQIKALAAGPVGAKLVWAGYDPATARLGGRALVDAERYRVATTHAVALNQDHAAIFGATPAHAEDLTVRAAAMAGLTKLRDRHKGFDHAYLDELSAWLSDDGTRVLPRWSLRLKPAEGTFQRFSIVNREPFGAVRNAQVNNPDSTLAGGKANVALTYEEANYDWEQRADLAYQRSEQLAGGKPQIAEQQDRVQLATELRIKALALRTPQAELGLVPFVTGAYLTEFTPTDDPKTGVVNPRRRELNGIAGLVLYPGGWVKELRAGGLLKNDLAQPVGGFEPGVQGAGTIEAPLGPLTLALDLDARSYFLTPDDTPDDLALLARVAPAVRIPVWGALGLSFGLDTWFFAGKVPGTRELGWSWTPSVGLTYNATWKPLTGVVF